MIATGSGAKEVKKLSAAAERLCRRFSLAEIQLATQDFSEVHLIGNGGFGKVYKGRILHDGKEAVTVAMKRLLPNSSNQGEGEFLTEIETLSKLRHVNLVSLIGYCDENGEMILVYEYIPRGTLADHLYRSRESDDCSSLTWKQRLNICIGAARGIDYLHTGTSIIHRDVKSTNILLDENFTAKVSDFGLAKHLSTSSSKSHVSTNVKGTFGYLDPSYFITCRLTQKSDTYAFGVVLLEVLCGRPAVDQRLGEDETSLVMWAREKISKGKADQIVASNLRDEISADCLKTFVGTAKRCLNHEPKQRPTMGQVVVQLKCAVQQQYRKAPTLNAPRLLPFWNRVKQSGSTRKNGEQVDVNTLSTAISTDQHTISMLFLAVPDSSTHVVKGSTADKFTLECLVCKGFDENVYCGTLNSGQVAAIKKLPHDISSLPDREFLEQVSLISCLKHENVAKLLDSWLDGPHKWLAYEFALNGPLHDILHGQHGVNGSPSWAQRVKTAIGAAKGLKDNHQKDNIRSRNILLFDDYEAPGLFDFCQLTYHTDDFRLDSGYYHPSILRQHLLDRHGPPEYVVFRVYPREEQG